MNLYRYTEGLNKKPKYIVAPTMAIAVIKITNTLDPSADLRIEEVQKDILIVEE